MTGPLRSRPLVEPGFEPVADAFHANFGPEGDVDAAFCLYLDGRPVVDLVAGALARPRTLQPVFSCTKGFSTLAVLHLADTGLLDLDAPVGRYWPELRAGTGLTIRELLAHRAGLPVYDLPLSRDQVCDGVSVVQALEAQEPWWAPGSGHGYHAVTFGFLAGELVRRASGRTIGAVLAGLAGPLGADVMIGLPSAERDRLVAVAPKAGRIPPDLLDRVRSLGPGSLADRALTLNGALPLRPNAYNDAEVLAVELPGSGGVASAHGIARLYAAAVGAVDGHRLVSASTLTRAAEPVSTGRDLVLGVETCFGTGFMLPSPEWPTPGPRTVGHPGAGGSLGLADPELGIGIGYTTTAMGVHLVGDPRATALVEATRRCLD